jgi:phosphoglycerate dehydrogenase-like enzyme
MRQIAEDQKRRVWDPEKYAYGIVEISGKTLGIFGYGGLGDAVARRAVGFGMRIYAVDIRTRVKPTELAALWGPDRLDDLFRISDVLVVAAPLTAETRGLIDRRRLLLLKPTSYIFVLSRGGIVNEAALAEALESGAIAGAGLDAVEIEPLPKASPLWDAPNLVISPHVSALTPEMYAGRRRIFMENLRRYLAGEPFLYVCDKKAGY